MRDTESTRQQFWLGSAAALMSAVAFSSNVTLSKLAYDFGTNLHALNLIRATVFLGCLLVAVWLSGSRVSIKRTELYRCLALGVLLCVEMYLLLASILFIPVALTILVFYTYPIMIALWTWRTGRRHFSYFGLGVMALAFIGLIITLTGSDRLLVGWDGRNGIALAFIAAICLAAILLLSERVLARQPAKIMMLYMLLSATAVVGFVSLFIAELTWPASLQGWLALCGSAVLYVVATLLLFKAVDLVGSLQTAIIDNTSPVWAMILGVIVLGQWLTAQQVMGAS
ncbi:MAG: DMT family transporter, partial [Gammaproteobacteria bacterium]|nr:DMT family transporter [Gammaproteobacteria bacterium]